MNDMTCDELAEVAAELALGVLTGRERAQAVAHLDQCEACREDVRQLLATSERLLGLLPESEPPAGFETQVLNRLGLPAPAPAPVTTEPGPRRSAAPWTRRLLAAAAAIVAIAGGGAVGWGLGHTTSSHQAPAQASLASAVFLTAAHQNVGQVFLYQGSPRWLYMWVDLPSGDGMVTCQVVSAGGQVTTVGAFRLAGGYGSWGSANPVGTTTLASARLVAANGKVLATATFG
jgi:hypothetical protein